MNVETNARQPEGHSDGAQNSEHSAESDTQFAPDQLNLEIIFVEKG